ncbi:MAG: NusG domain II-containing protein [Eubacteriales bacterium]|nr:NusG domain II-containing protein [Eubacteriales bacterium]
MKFFKKTDIIIIILIIVFCVAFLVIYNTLFGSGTARAEIYYGSELIDTVVLKKGVGKTIKIPQDENVVLQLFEDGSIAFVESDCPDKICIKTGRLYRVGQTAACIPNKVFVKILPMGNRDNDDIDIIIGR